MQKSGHFRSGIQAGCRSRVRLRPCLAGTTKFIWVTKGNKEEFYRFDKERNKKTLESDIPYFGETTTKKYKYAKCGFYRDKVKGQDTEIRTGDLKAVSKTN